LQTETATPSRPRFVIEEVTTGSVLLCAIRREVAQISNAFDNVLFFDNGARCSGRQIVGELG
ncbi:hypothetical protein, partial [Burkholderia contaminans]|uniref:hypothetical protein n=1 Tax=Burkholderia contaminans TaxID=488447 RepID=UPI001ABA863F